MAVRSELLHGRLLPRRPRIFRIRAFSTRESCRRNTDCRRGGGKIDWQKSVGGGRGNVHHQIDRRKNSFRREGAPDHHGCGCCGPRRNRSRRPRRAHGSRRFADEGFSHFQKNRESREEPEDACYKPSSSSSCNSPCHWFCSPCSSGAAFYEPASSERASDF